MEGLWAVEGLGLVKVIADEVCQGCDFRYPSSTRARARHGEAAKREACLGSWMLGCCLFMNGRPRRPLGFLGVRKGVCEEEMALGFGDAGMKGEEVRSSPGRCGFRSAGSPTQQRQGRRWRERGHETRPHLVSPTYFHTSTRTRAEQKREGKQLRNDQKLIFLHFRTRQASYPIAPLQIARSDICAALFASSRGQAVSHCSPPFAIVTTRTLSAQQAASKGENS